LVSNSGGHSLILVVKGEADRQRLFLGVRRMPGARGSTGDRLDHVTAAFQAALPGLAFQADTDATDVGEDRLEDFSNFAVITGIPSSRHATAPPSLDSVLQVARGSAFQLSIVAEPLDRALCRSVWNLTSHLMPGDTR
jgi:hypothetical protein